MGLLDLVKYVWRHPLNADGRAAALGRVARWQIASRLIQGPVALPFVDDTHLFAARGMTGATGNWYCGLHEVDEMAFVLHVLRRDDCFVDVGANIGSYTVLAAGAVGARVIAIEPIPSTFAHLERNVVLNGLSSRVQLHRIGLSATPGLLKFSADLDTVNHVLADGESGPSIDVPVRPLDEMLRDAAPVVIKIDVEGHERSVLEGAERTLAHAGLLAVIMETNGSGARYGVSDADLLAIMKRHGFSPMGYDPFARRLLGTPSSVGNTVFVRSPAVVGQRVASAPQHRLINATI